MSEPMIVALEQHIGYVFKNKDLIRDALTHPSFESSRFEILEFIGDRVIAIMAAEMLWHEARPENEKIYAQKFVTMTTKEALYRLGNSMRLEEAMEWRGCESHKNTIISDGCEAVFGALYLDGGLESAKQVFSHFWTGELSDERDPKSELNDWANKHGKNVEYSLLTQEGLPHKMNYTVALKVGSTTIKGCGSSIKNAEKQAAREFLDMISKSTGKKR